MAVGANKRVCARASAAGMQLGGLEGPAAARLAAIRDAFAGMNSGRLPPHMLFSDRDFDANDYEALLALDDGMRSSKGVPPLLAC